MTKPITPITCKEIDEFFNHPTSVFPPVKEFIKKMRLAEAHILDCPVCREKYSTLATAVDDVLNKK